LKLDEICSNIPEVFDDTVHKAHRWCLNNFTNVSLMKVPEKAILKNIQQEHHLD